MEATRTKPVVFLSSLESARYHGHHADHVEVSAHYMMVVGLDIGGTESSCAWSFTAKPQNLLAFAGWGNRGTIHNPTTLLLDNQKRFHSFGFDAEDKHKELVQRGEEKRWHLFRKFMKHVHREQGLRPDVMVKDTTGYPMPVLQLLTMSIAYLNDHFLHLFKKSGLHITSDDIKYVITAASLWDGSSRDFFSQAIIDAGVPKERFLTISESEAAFAWCQDLHVDKILGQSESELSISKPGAQSLIVNFKEISDRLGSHTDWTTELTVLETCENGMLEVISNSSDTTLGEPAVNKQFFQLLYDVFGQKKVETHLVEDVEAMDEFMRGWKTKKKRMTAGRTNDKITLRIPLAFLDNHGLQGVKKVVENSKHKQNLSFVGGKVRIEASIIERMYESSTCKLNDHVCKLSKQSKCRNMSTIILIGSFADSNFVQNVIERMFRNMVVVIPQEASYTVLKGSVVFGHKPTSISCGPLFKWLAVVAIDIGTTYSGYAYSLIDAPMDIVVDVPWNAGGGQLISSKTPTCVLLNSKKEFHSFGYEAENKWVQLVQNENHNGWYFFRQFKMMLHDNEGMHRGTLLEDTMGKTMPAITIFAMAIQYMKEMAIQKLQKQIDTIEQDNIKFVITVPAIWDDSAKMFMREATKQAGIDGGKLALALEPEAASVWCQKISLSKSEDPSGEKLSIAKAGTKYMVVDLGGGTVDITVHEKNIDGTLKELYAASGGPWGGTAVDKNFFGLLEVILGRSTLDRFKNEEAEDVFELQREFEVKKRLIKPAETDDHDDPTKFVTLRVPVSLKDIYEEEYGSFKTAISKSPYKNTLKWTADKFRLDVDIARQLFTKPLIEISKHLKDLFKNKQLEDVRLVLLVGGFSESSLIQSKLKLDFPEKDFRIPAEGGLAILRGAVLFGHQSSFIRSRVARYSYGTEHIVPFIPWVHPAKLKFKDGSDILCRGIFRKYVEKGAEIPNGYSISKRFIPRDARQEEITYSLYASMDEDPKYITDESCRHLGTFTVPLARGSKKDHKEVETTMVFGDTEIKFVVKQVSTGKEFFESFSLD